MSRKYKIQFFTTSYQSESVTVTADSIDDAIILAKAERIKKGLPHKISAINVAFK